MSNQVIKSSLILAAVALSALLLPACESQPVSGGSGDGLPPGFHRVQQGPDAGVQGFRPNSGLGDFKVTGGMPSN